MKLKTQHFWLVLPIVLGLGSVTMLFGVLPKIMQDEYVYSSQARNLPFDEHKFSNYLFSWVMSSTKFCSGDSFYTCAKSINALMFLVGILFVYAIAIKVLEAKWAVVATSITALSPLAIQVSYFMPETMYFLAMTITAWIAMVASEKGKMWLWGALGISLALTSFVKPHAIFLLPALMLFAYLIEARRADKSSINSFFAILGVTVAFFLSKFGVGFAFAGVDGLRLFGGYGSPIKSANRVIQSETFDGREVMLGGEPSTSIDAFLTVATSHLFMHAAVMLLIAGVPLLLALRVFWRVLTSRDSIGMASSFMLLTALLALTMLVLVPAFEGYVTAGGEDHSARLILRYYEFLIPLLVIAALLIPRFVESPKRFRFVQATLVAVASIGFAGFYLWQYPSRFVDSSTLAGFTDYKGVLIALSIAVAISAYIWAWRPNPGYLWISLGTTPLLIVTSMLVSQELLVRTSSNDAYFGFAGRAANAVLEEVEGQKIIVAGGNRAAVFSAMFWIDKAYTRDLVMEAGSLLASDAEILKGAEYLVVFDEIELSGEFDLLESGAGYRIMVIGK